MAVYIFWPLQYELKVLFFDNVRIESDSLTTSPLQNQCSAIPPCIGIQSGSNLVKCLPLGHLPLMR